MVPDVVMAGGPLASVLVMVWATWRARRQGRAVYGVSVALGFYAGFAVEYAVVVLWSVQPAVTLRGVLALAYMVFGIVTLVLLRRGERPVGSRP